MNMFEIAKKEFKIDKPIRLIELFAGIGAQAMALRDLGADFEHYRVVEFDKYAIASYNAIHGTNFPTMDITKISGSDLGIVETEKFTYLLTYLLVSLHGFVVCWKASWNEERQRNTFWITVGS
jgi:DNA (cytosine-5)-methyltransferase 1